MAKKVVAIVGSYRKGGTVDTVVDAVLAGAREGGAETKKIYLIDQQIEYCHNCRTCTQARGAARGRCPIEDDMGAIVSETAAADAIVLGSPVNYYNATAVFRTFLERLIGSAYWPWGQWSPKPRSKLLPRKAVLIASMAAPSFFMSIATGTPKALRLAAQGLGARPVDRMWIGLAAGSAKVNVSEKLLRRAHGIGTGL